ncbi:heme-thiolate peroxidase [Neopestalotiopsis clavispora]|nr:heme-thiolate peroxidase [Neopestalotiopsis clavispora]
MRISRYWSLSVAVSIPPTFCFPSLHGIPRRTPGKDEKYLLGLRETIARIQAQASNGTLFVQQRDVAKPVDVTGGHAFAAPDLDAGDQRGPCPGLNALANHGYIAHTGITTFTELLTAVHEVYNMDIDLAVVLITLALVFTGDPVSLDPKFSIGGVDARVSDLLILDGILLGEPRGLDGSHNFIETDGSLTRDDLYVTGNAWDMNMTKFLEVYAWGGVGVPLTFDDIGDIAAARWQEAVATNPYFWYGPLTGYLPRTGGFALTARTMSNYSEGSLEGVITKDMFKSFFAVIDDEAAESGMVYQRGHERMPNNWYRRPIPWGLVDLNLDVLKWSEKHPFLLDIGGNTGQVNTFTGLDLSNITGGLLNSAALLEDNNLICFSLEIAKTFGPNSLSTLYEALSVPAGVLTDALATPLLDLSCPVYADLSNNGQDIVASILATYPGAKKAGSAL